MGHLPVLGLGSELWSRKGGGEDQGKWPLKGTEALVCPSGSASPLLPVGSFSYNRLGKEKRKDAYHPSGASPDHTLCKAG